MDRKNQITMPPLWIWVLLLLIACLASVYVYEYGKTSITREYLSREKYIQNGFDTARGRPVVLLIGTSLFESGLDSSGKIAACLAEQGKNVVLLKLWKRAVKLSAFVLNMPVLKTVHPALVVVEANMLFYRPFDTIRFGYYADVFRHLITLRGKKPGYMPDEKSGSGFTDIPVGYLRAGLIDTLDLQSFRLLAESWQKSGTRFLFINMPIEASEEGKKWNSPDTANFMRNICYLKQKLNFNFYRPGIQMNSGCFYDHAHMNKKGVSIFSPVICKEIAKEIEGL